MDRISDLPIEVLDTILTRLPLKDIVQTSILSRQWRDKWLTISQLIFDHLLTYYLAYKAESRSQLTLINVVDQIIFRHIGSLDKFEFSCHFNFRHPHVIDRWLLHLLAIGGVKQINLMVGNNVAVLNGIYNFKELTELELCECALELPPTFEGFLYLKCLILEDVILSDDVFETLVQKCPSLERLHFSPENLNLCVSINARRLQSFSIHGTFDEFLLENAPLVHSATISLCPVDPDEDDDCNCNLFESPWQLPNIKDLKLQAATLMFGALYLESIPKRLNTLLYSLKNLEMDIDFKNGEEISAALCLLRSSPNLHKLDIEAVDHLNYEQVPWEADGDLGCMLNNLAEVCVRVLGLGSEQEFIKAVLASSPALKKIVIKRSCAGEEDFLVREDAKFLKELIRFKRDSPEVELYVFDNPKSMIDLGLYQIC